MEQLQNEPEDLINSYPPESLPLPPKSSRRILTILFGVVVFAALIYFINNSNHLSSISSSPQAQDANQVELSLDLSLLSQQLDSTFKLLMQRVTTEANITPQDRMLLANWMEFDRRFIERLQDREILKYEQVSAHLRLGNGLYLLNMPSDSISHFESAIGLLKELSAENPSIVGYQLDESDAYAGLGQSMYAAGRLKDAVEAIDDSIQVLKDPRYPSAPSRDRRLAELYQQKESMLAPMNGAQ